MKKLISMVMCVVLLLAASMCTAYAAPTPRYNYVGEPKAVLSISSNGQATCTGKIIPEIDVTKVVVSMTLQKKVSSSWTTQKSWVATYNNPSAISRVQYYNVGSGIYRLRVVFTVYCGSATETVTVFSSEVPY